MLPHKATQEISGQVVVKNKYTGRQKLPQIMSELESLLTSFGLSEEALATIARWSRTCCRRNQFIQ